MRRAVVIGAAVALAGAAAGCGGSSSNSNKSAGSASSAAPAQLSVWRMGASVPAQVTWMNGIVSQFHSQFPQFKHTTVKVDWIPWTTALTQFQTAFSSGKGGPDVAELGNTWTPGFAQQGYLGNITSFVNRWPSKASVIPGMLANDTQNGGVYAVPWYGGVRAIWFHKSQFAKAGLTIPASWAQLVNAAKILQKKYPGTNGLGAPSNFENGIVSFIWGAGGQIATQSNGKWTAELTSPQSQAGIRFYVDLFRAAHVSPQKYVGQTELGAPGATSGGAQQDFAKGALDMYIDGPWAMAQMRPISPSESSDWAQFPIPSMNGEGTAPVMAGGSDLAVWGNSKYKEAAWDLIQVMTQTANVNSFNGTGSGFFAPYTTALSSLVNDPLMGAAAKAAANTQLSPLNAKNWPTVDTEAVIPTMIKQLMNGADFTATVQAANTKLQKILNTGSA